MFVRSSSKGWSRVAAISWRGALQRFSFVFFIVMALLLLILGRVQPMAVDSIRIRTIDTLAPTLDAVSRPMTLINNTLSNMEGYFALRQENRKLREANAQLKDWQNSVAILEKENHELQALLHFKVEPNLAYISARVIADTGGSFSRGLIVTAGRTDGVREGMAAMTGDGLIGRVVEVGDWSSRIMLITDLNSRIPVTITGTNDRAILAGNNSPLPKLLYLPQDAVLTIGSHIVTSGHGGVFPPNLPVGLITADYGHGNYGLVPTADLGRVNYVRLVDFNLKGGIFNTIATRVETEGKSKKH